MRLIFTACSGRTGTAYLASLLTLVQGIEVRQEYPPALTKKGMERALQYMHTEIPPGTKAFVFVSHAFLKCGPEEWLKRHPETDLIVLKRPARQIALSEWRRFSIPSRTKLGCAANLSPYGKDLRYPIRNPEQLCDYALCYWHTLEIEARQKETAELFTAAGRAVHTLSMKQLVNWKIGHFQALLAALHLPEVPFERYRVIAKCKINGQSANSSMCRALPPNIHNFENDVTERHITK